MQTTINGVKVELIQGDITDLKVDAIVNAANSRLLLGSGVAGAIDDKGGPSIQAECDRIGHCDVGSAVVTGAGRLPAKHVIHAVGPRMGEGNEPAKLTGATRTTLQLAAQHNLESIAFPAISTGVYGYPLDACARIMLGVIFDFARQTPSTVKHIVMCLYDNRAYNAFASEFQKLLNASDNPSTA